MIIGMLLGSEIFPEPEVQALDGYGAIMDSVESFPAPIYRGSVGAKQAGDAGALLVEPAAGDSQYEGTPSKGAKSKYGATYDG